MVRYIILWHMYLLFIKEINFEDYMETVMDVGKVKMDLVTVVK